MSPAVPANGAAGRSELSGSIELGSISLAGIMVSRGSSLLEPAAQCPGRPGLAHPRLGGRRHALQRERCQGPVCLGHRFALDSARHARATPQSLPKHLFASISSLLCELRECYLANYIGFADVLQHREHMSRQPDHLARTTRDQYRSAQLRSRHRRASMIANTKAPRIFWHGVHCIESRIARAS
jgi:hypothetical protein